MVASFVTKLNDILVDFELLDDWEDRYRYVIELGRALDPLPDADRNSDNKVQGCVSQVWLSTNIDRSQSEADPILKFSGDSDAHIVRGLIAILFAIYSEQSARTVLSTDPRQTFDQLGLREHLTPQRSNGLSSMVSRIRDDAHIAIERSRETAN